MGGFEEKLNAILSNPEAMSQVMNLAQSLNLGGSGGSELEKVLSFGCDTFVTADIKYDVFLKAKEAGLNLIDADHFCTENVVIPVLFDVLSKAFPTLDLHISKQHVQTARFF